MSIDPDEKPFEPDAQQAAVLAHGTGAMLVTGGPGTGKTAVLRERFARLLEESADPERIALVVGSARARDRARRFLLRRVRRSLPGLRVVTAQGLAYHVLTREYRSLGYDESPAVLAAADHFAKVRDLLQGEDPREWPAFGSMLGLHGFADQVRQFLIRAQEALLDPDDIADRAAKEERSGWGELAGFYRRYRDVLDAEGLVDFAGLVMQAARAVVQSEPLLDHLLVDDYQDTTLGAEALFLSIRAGSTVVAGDAGAHVFSFQGTTDVPLEEFTKRVPSARRLTLGTRHRGPVPKVEAWGSAHASEEHAGIAHELMRCHVEDGVPWDRMAVVVRRQGPELEGLLRALDDAGVPRWTPEESTGLTAEPAVAPFVLALHWLARPRERGGLLEALLTSELAGLSPATARGVLRSIRASGQPPEAALSCSEGLSPEEISALQRLDGVLSAAREVADNSVLDAFRVLWRESSYSARLVQEAGRSEAERRDLDAVVGFAEAVGRAGESADPGTEAFLELLESGQGGPGAASSGWAPDAVQVLTAHGSVGLEFDTVILAGAVEGNFPSLSRPEPMFDLGTLERRITQSERNRLRLEDERRLFRTVLGRAARRVVCTASDRHEETATSTRSRFVSELDVEWRPAPSARASSPLSPAEAAVFFRRLLADPAAPAPARLGAIDGLLVLDADPARWWFQREWTDTGKPLHEQIRVSYSRLDTLENCELQFVLNQELGLGSPSGYHAWVGHLVHTLIDEHEQGAIERSLEAMVAEAEARWRPEEFPSFAVSEAFRRLVTRTMLPNWYDAYAGKPSHEHEKKFEFEVDGATVTGFIDRIGEITAGGYRITDYKTGKVEKAGNPAENLQLGVYALAVDEVEELAKFRPVRGVELAFLRGKRTDPEKVERVQFMPTSGNAAKYRQEMHDRLTGLIGRVRELYDSEVFRPSTSADCHWCDFKSMCPLWPEGAPLFPELEPAR